MKSCFDCDYCIRINKESCACCHTRSRLGIVTDETPICENFKEVEPYRVEVI